MKTVWKYQVPLEDYVVLHLPMDAEVLSFQVQNDVPYVWVLCNPNNQSEDRTFRLAGTGHPVGEEIVQFLGTIQMSYGLVFHLFEAF